jgi:hypothetical protein
MHKKFNRFVEELVLATFTMLSLCATSWGGPPLPPSATPPATPVGGTEVTVVVTVAIAAYGIWKYRK